MRRLRHSLAGSGLPTVLLGIFTFTGCDESTGQPEDLAEQVEPGARLPGEELNPPSLKPAEAVATNVAPKPKINTPLPEPAQVNAVLGGACVTNADCPGACEICDVGNTNTCIARPASFECRASAGSCDVAENCTGASADCPADTFVAASTECRAAAEPELPDAPGADRDDAPTDQIPPSVQA